MYFPFGVSKLNSYVEVQKCSSRLVGDFITLAAKKAAKAKMGLFNSLTA
jgi:hypothetical protein